MEDKFLTPPHNQIWLIEWDPLFQKESKTEIINETEINLTIKNLNSPPKWNKTSKNAEFDPAKAFRIQFGMQTSQT